jgi:hypothetical protein
MADWREMICMRMSQTTMYTKIRPPTRAQDSNPATDGQLQPQPPLLDPAAPCRAPSSGNTAVPRAGTLVSFPASLHADNYN